MPYINNFGAQIYYEVVGEGPNLLLQHGLTSSGEDWKTSGWVRILEKDYRLIIVDARGHGRSEKLTEDSDYSLSLMSQDIVAVLDNEEIEKAMYFGYSMGATIGYSLAKHNLERISKLVVGGASPFAITELVRAYLNKLLGRYRVGSESGAEVMLQYIVETEGEIHSEMAAIYRKKDRPDFQAYIALINQFLQGPKELTESTKNIDIPCLVYVGERDEVFPEEARRALAEYQNLELVIMPGLDHSEGFFDVSRVAPLVSEFLR